MHRASLLPCAAALLFSGGAAADPTLSCRALRVSRGAEVTLRVVGGLPEELLRLVRLGLPGKLHLSAQAVHPGFLFSTRGPSADRDLTLTFEPKSRELLLEGEPWEAELEERLALRGEGATSGEARVTLTFRVLTETTLDRAATWLSEGHRAPLPQALANFIAQDWTSRLEASCPIETRSP